MASKLDLSECLRSGLLREAPASAQKADQSLKAADDWLGEAEVAAKAGIWRTVIMSAYMAMFHSARAILFRDGFREKSHACIGRYLEGHYAARGLLE